MKPVRWVVLIWFLAGVFGLSVSLASANGWRINTTPSVPIGLWKINTRDKVIQPGVTVLICPTDSGIFRLAKQRSYLPSGSCPGNMEPMLKPVAAVSGDQVEVSPQGIRVNGKRIQNSQALKKDGAGRIMPVLPTGRYTVALGEIWLVSSHNPKSFDSRYFGPLKISQIQGTASPIWVGRG